MRREVIVIPHDMDVWTLARLFTEKEISGAPVVDSHGKLVGVVSQTDIVAHLKEVSRSAFGDSDFYASGEPDDLGASRRPVSARDIMSPRVISATPDAAANELAHILLSQRIHRIIITENGEVRGIVTASDLMKVL